MEPLKRNLTQEWLGSSECQGFSTIKRSEDRAIQEELWEEMQRGTGALCHWNTFDETEGLLVAVISIPVGQEQICVLYSFKPLRFLETTGHL